MTYAIAQYLTDEQKAAAVTATYQATINWKGRPALSRTDDGYCPMGVAFRATKEVVGGSPTSRQIAGWLLEDGVIEPLEEPTAVQVAMHFNNDWDAGGIRNLRYALGVEA